MKTTTLALVERATGVLHAAKISLSVGQVSGRACAPAVRVCAGRNGRIDFAA